MKLEDIYKKIDDLNEAASMNISLTGDSPQEVGELFKVLGDKDLNPEPMPSLGMRGDIEKSMDIMKKMDGPKDGPMPMKMPSDMPTKLTMQDEPSDNEDYANSPDEQHQDTKYMTKDLAGGLNKEKKTYPKVAGGDNPMALENKIKEELKAKFAEKFGEANEEMDPEVSDEMKGQINQWIKKYSKYIGGNGDTLPEGYMQWALNSGIATDFYDADEVEAFNKIKGYPADSNDSEWQEGDHDDFTGNKSGASPITTACLVELNKITGDDFIEDNAHIIDAVMHGDGNESTNEDTNNELLGDLKSGLEDAKAGNSMSDFIADEIGDYIRSGIEDMGEEAWQDSIEGQALAELDPVDTPEEQAKAFQNAINILKGGNESTNDELARMKELAGASIGEAKEDSFDEAGCKAEMKRLDASGCSKNEMLKKVDSKFGCGKEKFEKLYASSCGSH